VSIKEAARLADCSPITIRRAIEGGNLLSVQGHDGRATRPHVINYDAVDGPIKADEASLRSNGASPRPL
jgi:hypothetical protein